MKEITFGKFHGEPITWIVIGEIEDRMLLLSKYVLENRIFDDKSSNYENSDIRKYLNNEFYNDCFNDKEKAMILTTEVDNSARSANPHSNAKQYNDGNNPYACGNTQDKVFLLSVDDITNQELGFEATDSNTNIWEQESTTRVAKNLSGSATWYWLRSPYYSYGSPAWIVGKDGSICGNCVRKTGGVRPAMCIMKRKENNTMKDYIVYHMKEDESIILIELLDTGIGSLYNVEKEFINNGYVITETINGQFVKAEKMK